MRRMIKSWLLKKGMVLTRPPGQYSLVPVKLAAAKKRGLEIGCVVDGGASNGDWARELKQIYPQATVLCIEPREDMQADLRRLKSEDPKVFVAQKLIGPSAGVVEFNEHGNNSSAFPNSKGERFGNSKTVEMTTIDALVAEHKLPWPDLIKLDLQGFELDALRGAPECLKHAQALLLELSFFEFQKGQPLAEEVIGFLRERGFRICDIPALAHRPLDGALGQGDFLFVRSQHPLFTDNRWAGNANFS